MIPRDYITAWRSQAPWIQDFQVEQDLMLSRALVEMFSHPALADGLAFRGGTALHKLHLQSAARYSEDLDLVQIRPGPAGPIMAALHEALDPWLGAPRWKQSRGRVTFVYRFESEDMPPLPMKLKIEINSREHFSVFGFKRLPYAVDSRWFQGKADLVTYALDEILGTKLRALYQRRKGRDLFDLAAALDGGEANPDRVVEAFTAYLAYDGLRVSRAQFEKNLALKAEDPRFRGDLQPLLAHGHRWNLEQASQRVAAQLVSLLPGEPWKGVQ